MKVLLRNGRILDPASSRDESGDIHVHDGRIVEPFSAADADEVVDCDGLWILPGLVDMHVHLREPGKEDEETVASGAAAAVAGGFTAVAAMPNTTPPVDDEAAVTHQLSQGKRAGLARIHPIGCLTKGRAGEELAEIGGMVRAGAVGFSDDGSPVMNSDVMRRALQYCGMFDKVVIDHCEDLDLTGDGCMNEGRVSTRLGLPGIPAAGEEILVNRDLVLARETGARLHIAHVSTAGAVEQVRRAKDAGIRVTAEVTPHHLTMTDSALLDFNTNAKMYPPLRTQADVEACREGLADGTLDCIATDHAPHSSEKKDVEFTAAPNGAIGLETALPIALGLVREGILSPLTLARRMSLAPARILHVDGGSLAVGAVADITVVDPEHAWTVDPAAFRSLSRNSPFAGWEVRGRASHVLVGGRLHVNPAP